MRSQKRIRLMNEAKKENEKQALLYEDAKTNSWLDLWKEALGRGKRKVGSKLKKKAKKKTPPKKKEK